MPTGMFQRMTVATLSLATFAMGVAQIAQAGHGKRPCYSVTRPCPCEPSPAPIYTTPAPSMVTPTPSMTPMTPTPQPLPSTDMPSMDMQAPTPSEPLADQATTPTPFDSFDLSTAGPDLASSDLNLLAPNMYGDFFTSSGLVIDRGFFTLAQDAGLSGPATYNYSQGSSSGPLVVGGKVAAPVGGGLAGRTKLIEDNNPFPRDRVFMNYDYYSSVPLTGNDVDVHRFSPGFEKTFFDGTTSVEMRLPFAITQDSDFVITRQNDDSVELGNLFITLKALLYQDQSLAVASGVGLSLPTGSDTSVTVSDGTFQDVVTVRNESTLLSPYIAAFWTPNQRLFAQSSVTSEFALNSNPVDLVETTLATGDSVSVSYGELTPQTIMQIDGQAGYWVIDPREASVGVAGFGELHYNTTLGDTDLLGDNGTTALQANNVDELNGTVGVAFQAGSQANLALGATFPLFDGDNQFFDYQLGLRLNWFYGRTAESFESAQLGGF